MFSVAGIDLPYVSVARKGEVDVPPGAQGQPVGLESIEFANRFEVHADDARAAVMLIDQGMMQWLLDNDRVSFQVSGPLVSAIVKSRPRAASQADDLHLLFRFHDGFAEHVPPLIWREFPAPAGKAEAAMTAMQVVSKMDLRSFFR